MKTDMIVHLGQEAAALDEEIVMILDLTRELTCDTRAYLSRQRAQGRVEDGSEGAAKSAVVLSGRRRGIRVFLSPVSSATLWQRQSAGAAAKGQQMRKRGKNAVRAD